MELDEIKSAWEQYDKHLANNLSIDETKLKETGPEWAKNQMQYPFVSEMVELIGGLVVIVAVLAFSFIFIDEPVYLLVGLLTVFTGFLFIGFTIKKIRLLKQVEYYDTSVVILQSEIAFVKRKILQYRKIELLLYPVYIFPLIPITSKMLYGHDILESINLLAGKYLVALVLAYLIVFLIRRHFYDKKFKALESLLAKIKEFEKE